MHPFLVGRENQVNVTEATHCDGIAGSGNFPSSIHFANWSERLPHLDIFSLGFDMRRISRIDTRSCAFWFAVFMMASTEIVGTNACTTPTPDSGDSADPEECECKEKGDLPWWATALISLATTIVGGAIGSVTTCIVAHFQRKHEKDLQEDEHEHEDEVQDKGHQHDKQMRQDKLKDDVLFRALDKPSDDPDRKVMLEALSEGIGEDKRTKESRKKSSHRSGSSHRSHKKH